MNTREYLLKAQAADAIANTSEGAQRYRWEAIAAEYRRLARVTAVIRHFIGPQVVSKPVPTELPHGTSSPAVLHPPLA
jgi:hypothetical protein